MTCGIVCACGAGGAAAAAAADASVGGSGDEAAVLNTRLEKLLGSVWAWWPHGCGAESCRRVSGWHRVGLPDTASTALLLCGGLVQAGTQHVLCCR
jgi:hypothetical protein